MPLANAGILAEAGGHCFGWAEDCPQSITERLLGLGRGRGNDFGRGPGRVMVWFPEHFH